MLALFRLIRVYNLGIIAVTMYAMRWLIIYPFYRINDEPFHLNELDFFLLTVSTMLIAAGGNVINDYFDRKADRINKPDNVIVGSKIDRRLAIILHSALNIVGVGIGIYISLKVGHWKYSAIFILVTLILWFYSTHFKRKFLIGNIVIAFITAMVPFMVFLFEYPGFYFLSDFSIEQKEMMFFLLKIILGFSYFAFVTSLIREVIKDIEDIKGDMRIGCRSLPIVWGVKTAAVIAFVLIIIAIFSIAVIYFFFFSKWPENQANGMTLNSPYTLWYLVLIIILFVLALIMLQRSREKKDYKRLSHIMKLIMFVGVSYAFIYYFGFV